MKVNEKHSSEYLYGTALEGIANMPYYEALAYKIALAMLIKLNLSTDKAINIDTYRIVAVNKAITFNKGLLSEIGMSKDNIDELVSKVFKTMKEYSINTILESHKKEDKC